MLQNNEKIAELHWTQSQPIPHNSQYRLATAHAGE